MDSDIKFGVSCFLLGFTAANVLVSFVFSVITLLFVIANVAIIATHTIP